MEAEKRRRIASRKQSLLQSIEGWKKDFVSFAERLDVITKEPERIKLKPSKILLDFEKERSGRDIIVKARQVYFTTWELARDIWYMLVVPGSRVVILCPSDKDNRFVKEISSRIRIMLGLDDEAQADPEKKYGLLGQYPDLPIYEKSQTQWACGSSSLTISGAGATLKTAEKSNRGKTIHRLHVTEIAYFEYAEETMTAVSPCIGEGPLTEVIFECTPMGAAGYFYNRYKQAKVGDDGYKAHLFEWFRHEDYVRQLEPKEEIKPRTERENELVQVHKVTPEQLKWYRRMVAERGQAKVNQEYPSDDQTCWLFDGRVFFDPESLSHLRTKITPPIEQKVGGLLKIWVKPDPSHSYTIGVDPSNGVGGDPASATVIDRETGEHVASLHGNFNTDDFGVNVAKLGWEYNKALLVMERSASWDRLYKTLMEWHRPDGGEGYSNIYVGADKKVGINMNKATRPALLDALEEAIRKSDARDYLGFKTRDKDFVEEAFLFIVKDEKPQAAPGAHDDRIFSAALAWSQVGETTGLLYTDFEQAPSIAFENNSISFEDAPVLQEARGIGLIEEWGYSGNNDLDGF